MSQIQVAGNHSRLKYSLLDEHLLLMATMRETIKRMGLLERGDKQCRVTIGMRLEEIGNFLFPELDISGAEYTKIYREIFPTMQTKHPARPFEHVTECLDCMWNMHHPMAIASSRRKSSILEFLSELGATDWFQISRALSLILLGICSRISPG